MSSPFTMVAQLPLPLLIPPSSSPTPVSPAPASSSLATSDHDAPLGSNPQLGRLVTTVLPASAALLVVAFELLSRIRYPKPVQNVAYKLSRPFRNFFTLADVEAPVPCPLHQASWKARVLVVGSAVQSVGWLAVLAYRQEVTDWEGSVRAGVAFLAWVRTLLLNVTRRVFNPTTRAPRRRINVVLMDGGVELADVRAHALVRQATGDAPLPPPVLLRDMRGRGVL